MKDRILELIDAELGKVLLVIALLWAGWTVYANWYQPLPENLVKVETRPVYVEMDPKAKSQDLSEVYYVAGESAPYIVPGIFVFVPEVITKQFSPVELDIPQLTVKRPPQLLPEPGPSLEGADKLPRFGDEFPPPSAADLPPPPPKGTGVKPPTF